MKGIARAIQRRVKRVGVWDQVIAERDEISPTNLGMI